MPALDKIPPTSVKKILAIESSTKSSSLALLDNGDLVDSVQCSSDAAKNLFPLLKLLMADNRVSIPEIDLIAVTDGPGSFTGLRIGVTMAKTIAYSLKRPVVAVNTMRLLAFQGMETKTDLRSKSEIDVIMDAQRNQFFHARFSFDPRLLEIQPTTIVDSLDLIHGLDRERAVSGPGLNKLDLPTLDAETIEAEFWQPTARSLGRLAMQDYANGIHTDMWKLKPQYFRKSAAEEKADRSSANGT